MNNKASTSKGNSLSEDEEIFDDSIFLANFDDSSFKQNAGNNLNDSHNSALNVSALCCDEEISGYDKLTGQTWIYPTNYPVRDYQFNIIKAALVKNTLVSLPTGLGKTFIAAVIMYNFYRWYPLGKIVFTAPTRPLVAQQIDACYNIIAIPPDDTIEMTGHMQVNTRKAHWQNKRVFFATPQVIYNDIKSGICPANKIRCLVMDEAHRARGNYAYCQIVASLDDIGHKTYRMLALSATPGSKVDDVISVVKSLHIAHLELREENCIDVAPYSHSRKINTVVVQLGPELSQLRQQYVEILDGYARRLKQFNILPQNLGNLSKGRIVMLYKDYQTRDRGSRHPQHNYIMKDFTILISLCHGLELLLKHGSRVFLNFFDEHPEKSWIQADDKLTALLERLRDDLGINPLSLDRSILPDGTIPEIPKDLSFGHPKFDKLKSIMMEHFHNAKRNNQDTRAIVFCEYRESVNLVHCLLLQCRPLIMPQMFVGQGASGKDGKTVVSQKQQLRVMRSFRSGLCTALVATSVAEEGLDVGSVDLIVCFDISTRSPIRLVQRCGRTGRERGGQVHILVTEGKEHQTLLDCMRQRDGLNRKILQSKDVENNLYKLNPRMMPHGFTPECRKMYITVAKKTDDKNKNSEKKSKKGQKDLRSMLLNKASSSSSSSNKSKGQDLEDHLITEEEFKNIYPDQYKETSYIRKPVELWAMSKEKFLEYVYNQEDDKHTNLSKWLEWQRTLQDTVNIGHSKDTEMMVKLLQKADEIRFRNTQNTAFSPVKQTQPLKPTQHQSPTKAKTKRKPKNVISKSPAKKDGDIRALFSTATKSTKSYTKLINDLGIQNDGSIPTRLIDLLVDLNLDTTNTVKPCYICQNICDCNKFINAESNIKAPMLMKFITEPTLPSLDLIDDINKDMFKDANKSFDLYEVNDGLNKSVENKNNCSTNFDLEFDFDALDVISSPEAEVEKEIVTVTDTNFDLGDIDDIFAESSPEEVIAKDISKDEVIKDDVNSSKGTDAPKTKDALEFFGLDSIEDIFADSDDSMDQQPKESEKDKPSIVNDDIKVSNKPKSLVNTEIKSDFLNNRDILDESETFTLDDDFKTINKPQNIVDNEIKSDSLNKEDVLDDTLILDDSPVKEGTENSAINKNHTDHMNKPNPVSPSILSGVLRKELPTSPILCSQGKKFQLSTKKSRTNCSTPNSRAKKKLSLPETENNNVIEIADDLDEKPSVSMNNTTNKSMFTITQLVDMINKDKTVNNTTNLSTNEDRSTSPILLTQADKKKASLNTSKNTTQKCESLIILDSDSDSNSTLEYDFNEIDLSQGPSTATNKRKFDDEIQTSPYFSKKPKLDFVNKPLTLQQKVLAAIKSNKEKEQFTNTQTSLHFTVSQPNFLPLKEKSPNKDFLNKSDENIKPSPIESLQKYRRDKKIQTIRNKFNSIFKKSPQKSSPNKENMFEGSDDEFVNGGNENKKILKDTSPVKRKIQFGESDDDFVSSNNSSISPKKSNTERKPIKNHKVRKKKRKNNSLLDMEAALSDDGTDSGDELSDDSAGSIAEFICDDDVTRGDDIHMYLKSVKSPVKKNGFKIPELPKKFNKADVFSQFIEEDNYEMDSFCVDSHIGMTQVNEVSELELAEFVLEEERKSKRKAKRHSPSPDNDDSPIVKRRIKKTRRIHSDSDDSS